MKANKTVMDAVNEFKGRFEEFRYIIFEVKITGTLHFSQMSLVINEAEHRLVCTKAEFNGLLSQLETNFGECMTIRQYNSIVTLNPDASVNIVDGVIEAKAKIQAPCGGKIPKPVFTQAMADAGELPPIGSLFIDVELNDTDDNTAVLAIAHDLPLKRVVYKRGETLQDTEYFGAVAHECKPIDQRTDREKLFDQINSVPRIYIDDANKLVDDIISGKIHGVEWVGK